MGTTWWVGDQTGRDPGSELEGLRRAVAELVGSDPETWPSHGNAPLAIASCVALERDRVKRLERWVADLHSGMYVNCVYCGHRYGPGETTPVSMADALKEHVERCPEHPMSTERQEAEAATDLLRRLIDTGRQLEHSPAFRAACVEARKLLESAAPPAAPLPDTATLAKRAADADSALFRLADAVLAYDEAIRACANDPKKMASFCTAEGDSLDKLYADMLRLAGQPERANEAFDGAPAAPPEASDPLEEAVKAAAVPFARAVPGTWEYVDACTEWEAAVAALRASHADKGEPGDG